MKDNLSIPRPHEYDNNRHGSERINKDTKGRKIGYKFAFAKHE